MQITTIITAFGLVAAAIAAPAAQGSPKEGLKKGAKVSWGHCCAKTVSPRGGDDGCKYQQNAKPSCSDKFPIPWTCTFKADDYYNKGKEGGITCHQGKSKIAGRNADSDGGGNGRGNGRGNGGDNAGGDAAGTGDSLSLAAEVEVSGLTSVVTNLLPISVLADLL